MICVLDSSVGVSVSLKRVETLSCIDLLCEAELVLAPELYISEVTNTFWKYYQFKQLDFNYCKQSLDFSFQLVDTFIHPKELYAEAFAFACQNNHPVYDALYLILAQRNNATLLTLDKKLTALAGKNSIDVI